MNYSWFAPCRNVCKIKQSQREILAEMHFVATTVSKLNTINSLTLVARAACHWTLLRGWNKKIQLALLSKQLSPHLGSNLTTESNKKSISQYWFKPTILDQSRYCNIKKVSMTSSVRDNVKRTNWNVVGEDHLRHFHHAHCVEGCRWFWAGRQHNGILSPGRSGGRSGFWISDLPGSRLGHSIFTGSRTHTGWNSPSHSLSVSTSHRSSHPRPAHSLEFLWTTTSTTQHPCHHHHLLSNIKACRLSAPLS